MHLRVLVVCLAVGLVACSGGSPSPDPVSQLESRFPLVAGRVLGGGGFQRSDRGFTVRVREAADPLKAAEESLARRGGLQLELPAEQAQPVRLSIPGGLSVEVRELGLRGTGRVARGAVAYEGEGRTSFWTATEQGYEEWLLAEVGETGVVAEWEVEGGTLREVTGRVEVLDAQGHARLRVSAPVAYGADGREAKAWLAVRGGRLALVTEARGLALVDPLWAVAKGMWRARRDHTMTLLQDGRVLVAGGTDGTSALTSCELYDPATNRWTETNGMYGARYQHTATLMSDGTVVVTGGRNAAGTLRSAEYYLPGCTPYFQCARWWTLPDMSATRIDHAAVVIPSGSGDKLLVTGGRSTVSATLGLRTAELYDYATGSWITTAVPNMGVERTEHTVTLLADGKTVLATGGRTGTTYQASWETYDSSTNAAWSAGTGTFIARARHTATLLQDGTNRVVVAGGYNGSAYLGSTQAFNPTTRVWTNLGSIATRADHEATLMTDGRVIVSGGFDGTYLSSVQVFTPATSSWSTATAAVSMYAPRAFHAAVPIANGSVLIAGGYDGAGVLPDVEVYIPGQNNWSAATTPMASGRYAHTSTLLSDGSTVLISGGIGAQGGTPLSTALLFNWRTGVWSQPSNEMSMGRSYHAAALMPNGEVLLAGGGGLSASCFTADTYNPSTRRFTATPAMSGCRYVPKAVVLSNGRVLVVGDRMYDFGSDLYDPQTRTWRPTSGPVNSAFQISATLLTSGKVLVAGNSSSSSSDLYDPVTNAWSAAGAFQIPRRFHAAALLRNGMVLAAGGLNSAAVYKSAELFDPSAAAGVGAWQSTGLLPSNAYYETATLLPRGDVLVSGSFSQLYSASRGDWRLTGPMTGAGDRAAASLLPDGRVLLTGGLGGATPSARAEFFRVGVPGSWNPVISSYPSAAMSPGGTFTVGVSSYLFGTDGGGQPSVTILRQDTQMLLDVPCVSVPPTTLNCTLPTTTPGGWYWLRVSVDGVDSEARLVRVNPVGLANDFVEVLANGTVSFSPTGGTGPYTFLVDGIVVGSGPSYLFTAGSTVGATYTVVVVDQYGNEARSTVRTVAAALALTPATFTTEPGGCTSFHASGGSGTYRYLLSHLSRGSATSWRVPPNYCAGTLGGVTDLVWVVDAFGNAAKATITVLQPLALSASANVAGTSSPVSLSVTGGQAPYTWSASSGSGGSLSSTNGAAVTYLTGGTPGADVITVTDGLGFSSTVGISVYGASRQGGDFWTRRADLAVEREGLAVASVNGLVYAVGGLDGAGVYRAELAAFDPAGTWTALTPMPGGGRAGLASAVVGTRLFVVGGDNGTQLGTLEEYDTSSAQWTGRPAMSAPRTYSCAAAVNGKVYVIGGYSTSLGVTGRVDEYDTATGQWTQTPRQAMPTPRQKAACAVVNGLVHVFGGTNGTSVLTNVETYDPVADAWQERPAGEHLPVARHSASAAEVNGRILLLAGTTATAVTNLVQEYHPASGSWTNRAPMSTLRASAGAAVAGGKVYVVGGYGPDFGRSAVEEYVPAQPRVPGDLDGDGKSDLLWRSTSTGLVYAYLATGTNGTDYAPFYVTTQPLDYQVAGIGDFDGNGRSDLLWRGTTLGDVYLYAATGAVGSDFFTPRYVGAQPPEWRIVGVGDFDGDGKSDILWRSDTSGLVYAYLATGTNGTEYQPFYVTTQPLDYQVAGIGDFDGNGRSDILWRGATLGDVYLYAATGAVGPDFFTPRYVGAQDAEWRIVGVGDFDGDGKSDLLWRSDTSGLVYAYLATGTSGTEYRPFYVTTQPLDYQVDGLGDFDGNGRSDILWRGTTLGDVYLYAAMGAVGPDFFQQRFVVSQPVEWQLVP